MNPETSASRKFRKKLPSQTHQVRVENPANPGTPDLNCCLEGVEFWIEFKQVKTLPKRSETPVFTRCLEPHQALWAMLRTRAGGRSYVVGYVEELDEFFIIPGKMAMEFNSMTIDQLRKETISLEEMWTTYLSSGQKSTVQTVR